MRPCRRDPRRSSRSPALTSLVVPGLAALPLLAGATVVAQDCGFGDLDPTWAITEVVDAGRISGVDLLPDGRVYAAMETDTGSGLFFTVTRTLTDGTPDTSFAGDGRLDLQLLGAGESFATDVDVTSDGGAVAVGSVWDEFGTGDYPGAVVRITADGQLDPAFGNAGLVLVPGGSFCNLTEVEVLADGRIVMAGRVSMGFPGPDMVLARFLADGTPDATFGTSGLAYHDAPGNPDEEEIAIGPDGSVVLVAQDVNSVIRYDATGQLDPTFGVGGSVELTMADPYRLKTVAIDVDGGVVVGGTLLLSPNNQIVLTRLLADGSLDTGWGTMGTVTVPQPFEALSVGGIVSDGGGGHYLTASVATPVGRQGIAHLQFGGVPDGELTLLDMDGVDLRDEAVDNRGRLIVGGRFGALGPDFEAVVRFLTDDVWEDVGGGLAGAGGIPALSGSGCPAQGETFGIDLTGAAPDAVAYPILGYKRSDMPLLGGTLIPTPDVFAAPRLTDGNGDIAIGGTWTLPPLSGLYVYVQFWVTDPSGPVGFSASNGLLVRIP